MQEINLVIDQIIRSYSEVLALKSNIRQFGERQVFFIFLGYCIERIENGNRPRQLRTIIREVFRKEHDELPIIASIRRDFNDFIPDHQILLLAENSTNLSKRYSQEQLLISVEIINYLRRVTDNLLIQTEKYSTLINELENDIDKYDNYPRCKHHLGYWVGKYLMPMFLDRPTTVNTEFDENQMSEDALSVEERARNDIERDVSMTEEGDNVNGE